MKKLLCLLVYLHPIAGLTQMLRMGGSALPPVCIYSAHEGTAVSLSNPASMAGLKKMAVLLSGERRFMLQDLGVYQLAVAVPLAGGGAAITAGRAGNAFYHESHLGIAYARKIAQADIGIRFNYYGFGATGYGSAPAFTIEAAFAFHLSGSLVAGLHVYNPTSVHYGKRGEEWLPFAVAGGIGFDASENFFLAMALEKWEGQPINFSGSMTYRFDKRLFARAGIHTGEAGFFAAAGTLLGSMGIEAGVSVHARLGPTPVLRLTYNGEGE